MCVQVTWHLSNDAACPCYIVLLPCRWDWCGNENDKRGTFVVSVIPGKRPHYPFMNSHWNPQCHIARQQMWLPTHLNDWWLPTSHHPPPRSGDDLTTSLYTLAMMDTAMMTNTTTMMDVATKQCMVMSVTIRHRWYGDPTTQQTRGASPWLIYKWSRLCSVQCS